MNAPSRGGAFIRRGRLKEGGVYLLFLIYRGAFIRGRRLKKGGHLLEDLRYVRIMKNMYVNIKLGNHQKYCFYVNQKI